ncbi:MAG: hypothetical protein LBT14_00220 [Treponema sp.]|jgi:type I site-specific restriction endonuclease|nr:hypothetical protein [Treponema sp.]
MLDTSVSALVNTFRDQYDSYSNPLYNETQMRRDFLDKCIKALGWDVDNEQGNAEPFKEVIHGDRVRIGNQTRAPDYCIRNGSERLFYIEAKKPSVHIRDDADSAFQVRRYGWNAKMPLCLLSNFAEFAVYDTSIKPNSKDAAAMARIFYCRYDKLDKHNPQYPDSANNWEFLH